MFHLPYTIQQIQNAWIRVDYYIQPQKPACSGWVFKERLHGIWHISVYSFLSAEHYQIVKDIRELIYTLMYAIYKVEHTILSLQYFIRNLFFNIEGFMSEDNMSLDSHSCIHFPE